jgi:hypothetical protein
VGKAPAFERASFDVEELESGEEATPGGAGDEEAGMKTSWAALLARLFASPAWAAEQGASKARADVLRQWIVTRRISTGTWTASGNSWASPPTKP